LQSKRYAKSIARRFCFQHFLWRRTARLGGNTCATVSDRFEMPAPTLAEFLLDKLLPPAKSGLLGFGYASGPTPKRCFLQTQLNTGITAIRTDGTWQRINNQWTGK
jgi:hypothetical protein